MNRLIVLLVMLVGMGVNSLSAQNIKLPKVDKSPADIAVYPNSNNPAIKVIYSRPMMNGREVFGNLVKYGKVWRTGANEATMVIFYQDVMWGETEVAAGEYAIFSVPGEETWQVMLNSDAHQWGAYQMDKSLTVATVEVPAEAMEDPVEAMAITMKEVGDKVHLIIAWENTMVQVPISME